MTNAQQVAQMSPFFDPETFIKKFWGKEWGIHPESPHGKSFETIPIQGIGVIRTLKPNHPMSWRGARRLQQLLMQAGKGGYRLVGVRSLAFMLNHPEEFRGTFERWKMILRQYPGTKLTFDRTILSYYGEPIIITAGLNKEGELCFFPKSLNEQFGEEYRPVVVFPL